VNILNDIRRRASEKKCRIVFPEGLEGRTLKAVKILLDQDIAKPIILGDVERVRSMARELDVTLPSSVVVVDPKRSEKISDFASELFNLRKAKGMTYEEAKTLVQGELFFGAMMVRRNECNGMVAGAVSTTADVLRSAIYCVGTAPGIKTVSSIFLMIMPEGRAITYGDCAVMPYPDASQLADIAIASAESHRQLTGEEPVVAMLSFSTKGSAKHESVDKVTAALKIARSKRPDLTMDGELQFDTAYVKAVGERKAPGSLVAGKANVFIFPNLDAGNISYKITERIGGAQALGPIVQGLAKPINDLSRGCTAEDIANVTAICCIKA